MELYKDKFLPPKGFKATGVKAGIKESKDYDLCYILSDVDCVLSKVETKNKCKAAPLLYNKTNVIDHGNVRGIFTSSGNANAATGEEGIKDCDKIITSLAKITNVKKEQLLISSTGIIGKRLPLDLIINNLGTLNDNLDSSEEAFIKANKAILTTDTVTKYVSLEATIDGKKVTVSGMAKGSGMIHPNMATMLSYIVTDVSLSRELLDKALKEIVKDTFNMISVDADTSTNDMLVVLANGEAKNSKVTEESEDYKIFYQALNEVSLALAKKIVADGEGLTKTFTVNVKGVALKSDARLIAKSIISSNLVKTAIFGKDLNWGRIVAALGNADIEGDIDLSKATVSFKSKSKEIQLFNLGETLEFDEGEAKELMSDEDLSININLNSGGQRASAYGCDLTYDYIKINADYRT